MNLIRTSLMLWRWSFAWKPGGLGRGWSWPLPVPITIGQRAEGRAGTLRLAKMGGGTKRVLAGGETLLKSRSRKEDASSYNPRSSRPEVVVQFPVPLRRIPQSLREGWNWSQSGRSNRKSRACASLRCRHLAFSWPSGLLTPAVGEHNSLVDNPCATVRLLQSPRAKMTHPSALRCRQLGIADESLVEHG